MKHGRLASGIDLEQAAAAGSVLGRQCGRAAGGRRHRGMVEPRPASAFAAANSISRAVLQRAFQRLDQVASRPGGVGADRSRAVPPPSFVSPRNHREIDQGRFAATHFQRGRRQRSAGEAPHHGARPRRKSATSAAMNACAARYRGASKPSAFTTGNLSWAAGAFSTPRRHRYPDDCPVKSTHLSRPG